MSLCVWHGVCMMCMCSLCGRCVMCAVCTFVSLWYIYAMYVVFVYCVCNIIFVSVCMCAVYVSVAVCLWHIYFCTCLWCVCFCLCVFMWSVYEHVLCVRVLCVCSLLYANSSPLGLCSELPSQPSAPMPENETSQARQEVRRHFSRQELENLHYHCVPGGVTHSSFCKDCVCGYQQSQYTPVPLSQAPECLTSCAMCFLSKIYFYSLLKEKRKTGKEDICGVNLPFSLDSSISMPSDSLAETRRGGLHPDLQHGLSPISQPQFPTCYVHNCLLPHKCTYLFHVPHSQPLAPHLGTAWTVKTLFLRHSIPHLVFV